MGSAQRGSSLVLWGHYGRPHWGYNPRTTPGVLWLGPSHGLLWDGPSEISGSHPTGSSQGISLGNFGRDLPPRILWDIPPESPDPTDLKCDLLPHSALEPLEILHKTSREAPEVPSGPYWSWNISRRFGHDGHRPPHELKNTRVPAPPTAGSIWFEGLGPDSRFPTVHRGQKQEG